MATRTELIKQLRELDSGRRATNATYLARAAVLQAELDALSVPAAVALALEQLEPVALTLEQLEPVPEPPLELEPDFELELELPSPRETAAPSLEEALGFTPTAEQLELKDPGEVMTLLGSFQSDREEHDMVRAWAEAGNREALTTVAAHVPSGVGRRAWRALNKRSELAPEPTDAVDSEPTSPSQSATLDA